MGLSSGGKVLCAQRGCKFYVKVGSDELFEHCRVEHKWRDYPCHHENCNYVAFSLTCLKKHSRFHSAHVSTHYEFRCSKPNCPAGFKDRYVKRMHENVHDNIQLKCVFCPFTTVEHTNLSLHQRAHFNIRDHTCEGKGLNTNHIISLVKIRYIVQKSILTFSEKKININIENFDL